MRHIFKFALCGILFLNLNIGFAETLENNWTAESVAPGTTLSKHVLNQLETRHVVFVDGIMNELAKFARNYFSDNMQVINSLGMTYSHLRYSSQISIPENAEYLVSDLMKISKQVRKPIVLIGHSMGGGEALYAALKRPDLFEKGILDRVIVIEAAIGGAVLAENFNQDWTSRQLKAYLGEGLVSLGREKAHENFAEVYRSFLASVSLERHQNYSKRVYYVRSRHNPDRQLSWGLRVVRNFCKTQSLIGNDHDGLLETRDQMLDVEPAFGTDLGVLVADHIELVISGFSSASSKERRQAFTRALLSTVFEPALEGLTSSNRSMNESVNRDEESAL